MVTASFGLYVLHSTNMDYLLKNRKDIDEGFLVDEDFESFVQRMAKNGTFVDNFFIEACSKAHQLRFKIKDRAQDVIIGQEYKRKVTIGLMWSRNTMLH